MLGFVALAIALTGWWAQDLVGTLVNEGEADTREEVAFTAEAGTHRVVTSGPNRPEIDRTVCDIVRADGSELHIIGGTGDVNPVETFGTSRVAQFDALAGPTTVTCIDRLSPSYEFGRFQVIASNGPIRTALTVAAGIGILALAGGILWGLALRRRATEP